ncbi:MAG: helix-turn-helix transcriptional regulator [Bacteroidota bacterium]
MENQDFTNNFSEHKNKYGRAGSIERAEFEAQAKTLGIGLRIKHLRNELQMSQEELAEKVKSSTSEINKIEKGEEIPISTIIKIFDHGLEKPIRFLIGEVL